MRCIFFRASLGIRITSDLRPLRQDFTIGKQFHINNLFRRTFLWNKLIATFSRQLNLKVFQELKPNIINYFRIAVASNEYVVHVWDLTRALAGATPPDDVIKDEFCSADLCETSTSKTDDSILVNDVTQSQNEVVEETFAGEESPSTDVIKRTSSEPKTSVPVFSTPTVVLSGHFQRVIFLAWSPHEDGKLLSVSYDNTAQVQLM